MHPASLDWRGRLTGTMLGSSVTGGLSTNILSGDYRWRAVIVALSVGTILAASFWLHQRPGSAVARWAVWALLTLSFAGSLLALLGPAMVRPWASGAVAALIAGAVLVPRQYEAAFRILIGAGMIGIGLTSIVKASDFLYVANEPGMLNASSVAMTAVGAAGVALGWAALSNSVHYMGHGIIGVGCAMGAHGLIVIAGGPPLLGLALTIAGLMFVLIGSSWTKMRYGLLKPGLVGLGVPIIVVCIYQVSDGHILLGMIFLTLAALFTVSGFGVLCGRIVICHVAQLGVAITNATFGAIVLTGDKPLYGVGLLGVAAGGLVYHLNSLRQQDLWRRLQVWWQAVSSDTAVMRAPIEESS
jgi:hypothetical protein